MQPAPTWWHGDQSRRFERVGSRQSVGLAGARRRAGGIRVDAAIGLMVSLALLLACALALLTLFALTAPGRAADGSILEPRTPAGHNGLSAARLPTTYRRWRHVRRRLTGRVARGRSRIVE